MRYCRALRLRKVPAAVVRLADECHGFNAEFPPCRPPDRVARILFLRVWFDKYRRV